ncbi:MAG TPA: DUF5675 family protein [Gammaproteobacteria bacterium]|nr:DUF5675 family protein [Gammaproteobacteria bacterium]
MLVDRFVSDADTTLSKIVVDGSFACFGLEDEFREKKVAKETRIPAGRYSIELQTEGTLHQKYSQRFADIHRGMLHLLDVPNFTGIMIHVGNTDKDTEGCLLVGSEAVTEPGRMSVTQSVAAYRRLYQIVVDAAAAGDLTIEILDNDRPLAMPQPTRGRPRAPLTPPAGAKRARSRKSTPTPVAPAPAAGRAVRRRARPQQKRRG